MKNLSWPQLIAYAVTVGACAFLVYTDKASFPAVVAIGSALFAPSPLKPGGKS